MMDTPVCWVCGKPATLVVRDAVVKPANGPFREFTPGVEVRAFCADHSDRPEAQSRIIENYPLRLGGLP